MAHSLDIISCLEVQRLNDRLKKDCERLKRTNADVLQTLLRSQQEVAKYVGFNKKLQYEVQVAKTSTSLTHRKTSAGHMSHGHTLEADGSARTASYESVASSQLAALRVQLDRERKRTSTQAQRLANLEASRQEADVKLQWCEEQCTELRSSNRELEARLREAVEENRQLQASTQQTRERLRAPAAALQELAKVSRKCSRATDENKRLRAELGVIDEDFFQEIADMKYALQQSLALNRAYEQALQQVCQKYRLPFPDLGHRT